MPEERSIWVTARINDITRQAGGTWSVSFIRKETGEHLSVNGQEVMSSASVIKLPIIVEIYRQALQGELNLNDEVELTEPAKVSGSGVLQAMHAGTRLTIRDLAALMIMVSDNTATNLLIDLVGMDRVNKLLRSLALRNTVLARKMYDWEAKKAGNDNVCTADDIASLLAQIARGEALPPPQSQEIIDILSLQQFRCKVPMLLPDEVRIANKTGEVAEFVHDAALVFAESLTYSLCVLSKGAATRAAAYRAIAEISKTVYEYMKSLPESYL